METQTNTEKTLMPSYWAGAEVESAVGPGPKPRLQPYDATAPSAADLEKINRLIQERRNLPKGSRKRRLAIAAKIWRLRHPDYEGDRDAIIRAKQKWLVNNAVKRKQVALAWYYRNRGPLKSRVLAMTNTAIRHRNYRQKYIQYTLRDRLRVVMGRAMRRQWVKKSLRTIELIGCTVEELRRHIENQFLPEMTWDNRNKWQVDHEVPLCIFDLRNVEEQKLAFGWRNLRPMWETDNKRKQSTVPNPLPDWLPAHIAERITLRSERPIRHRFV